jgi:hypothetical protein
MQPSSLYNTLILRTVRIAEVGTIKGAAAEWISNYYLRQSIQHILHSD